MFRKTITLNAPADDEERIRDELGNCLAETGFLPVIVLKVIGSQLTGQVRFPVGTPEETTAKWLLLFG
jgi:hypothetical protein